MGKIINVTGLRGGNRLRKDKNRLREGRNGQHMQNRKNANNVQFL